MDDFGAPSGQIQISFKFNCLLIKNGRFRSSRWPDPNFIEIPLNCLLKMDDFAAPSGQIQISLQFNSILIKSGRFRSSQWPDHFFFKKNSILIKNGRFQAFEESFKSHDSPTKNLTKPIAF